MFHYLYLLVPSQCWYPRINTSSYTKLSYALVFPHNYALRCSKNCSDWIFLCSWPLKAVWAQKNKLCVYTYCLSKIHMFVILLHMLYTCKKFQQYIEKNSNLNMDIKHNYDWHKHKIFWYLLNIQWIFRNYVWSIRSTLIFKFTFLCTLNKHSICIYIC